MFVDEVEVELIAGNGGSACDSEHNAGELIGRFVEERSPGACRYALY